MADLVWGRSKSTKVFDTVNHSVLLQKLEHYGKWDMPLTGFNHN